MIKQPVSIGRMILGILTRRATGLLFSSSSVLAVGSADMTTQVFSVPLLDKLHRFTLAGHGREIVGAFFEQDSLNVCKAIVSICATICFLQIMTICKNAKVNYWSADMDLASMQPMPYIPDEDEDNEDDDNEQEPTTTSNGHVDNEDDEQLDDVVERERVKLERKQKRLDERLSKNPTKDDMVVFKRVNKYVNQ